MDDLTLMSHVLRGEIEKMSALYERYRMPVYYYFFKLTCGNREASEDLVHTVFYRVIRYRHSFTGHGNFASWLFRIARNTGIDYNRSKKEIEASDPEFRSGVMASLYEDEDEDEKNDQIASLELAMKKLEHDDREIITLAKLKCLKYSEIAGILGITEGNVKIRMFRAVRRLREIFLKIENVRYEKKGSG